MFSRKHSTITKGILILFMLAHHLFSPDMMSLYPVKTLIRNPVLVTQITTFFKICVAGFSFLSAFGITRALKQNNPHCNAEDLRVIARRLLRLEAAVVLLYIAAAAYKQFVVGQSIGLFYAEIDRDPAHIVLSMIIDALGLAAFMGTPSLNVTWWYLSYAILLITVMPFICRAYERFRYLLLPAACMLSLAVPNMRVEFWCYLPTAFLGCAFAYENWFERLKAWKQGSKAAKTGKFFVCLFLFYLAYLLSKYTALEFSYLLVFVIPYGVYEFIACIPGLGFCLEFLGKHSANIFLVHTFIYYYFYPDFIYSFRDSWKILPVLLVLCLAVSILIELFRKYTGYNKLIQRLYDRI